MKNITCIVCGSEFSPRRGKLYCSNACKQEAFKNKGVYSPQKTGIEPDQSQSTKFGYIVNYAEWLDLLQSAGEEGEVGIKLSEYYFIRLMLETGYDRALVLSFLGEFFDDNGRAMYDKSSVLFANYQQFKRMIQNKQVKFIMADFSFVPQRFLNDAITDTILLQNRTETVLVPETDHTDTETASENTTVI